jgi:hypothetical protein
MGLFAASKAPCSRTEIVVADVEKQRELALILKTAPRAVV